MKRRRGRYDKEAVRIIRKASVDVSEYKVGDLVDLKARKIRQKFGEKFLMEMDTLVDLYIIPCRDILLHQKYRHLADLHVQNYMKILQVLFIVLQFEFEL